VPSTSAKATIAKAERYLSDSAGRYPTGTAEYYARLALAEALAAAGRGNFGIGAVAVVVDGDTVREYRSPNAMFTGVGAIDHAEIRAVLRAKHGSEPDAVYPRDLNDATRSLPDGLSLFSSVEPCPMCASVLTNVGARSCISTTADGEPVKSGTAVTGSTGAATVIGEKRQLQPEIWQSLQDDLGLNFLLLETEDQELRDLSLAMRELGRNHLDRSIASRSGGDGENSFRIRLFNDIHQKDEVPSTLMSIDGGFVTSVSSLEDAKAIALTLATVSRDSVVEEVHGEKVEPVAEYLRAEDRVDVIDYRAKTVNGEPLAWIASINRQDKPNYYVFAPTREEAQKRAGEIFEIDLDVVEVLVHQLVTPSGNFRQDVTWTDLYIWRGGLLHRDFVEHGFCRYDFGYYGNAPRSSRAEELAEAKAKVRELGVGWRDYRALSSLTKRNQELLAQVSDLPYSEALARLPEDTRRVAEIVAPGRLKQLIRTAGERSYHRQPDLTPGAELL
jgi:tRNA(Arg) A34 adenosine deaminase TadA